MICVYHAERKTDALVEHVWKQTIKQESPKLVQYFECEPDKYKAMSSGTVLFILVSPDWTNSIIKILPLLCHFLTIYYSCVLVIFFDRTIFGHVSKSQLHYLINNKFNFSHGWRGPSTCTTLF